MKILRKRAASLGSTADSQPTTPSKRSRGDNVSTSAKRVKSSQTDKSEKIVDKVTETLDQVSMSSYLN